MPTPLVPPARLHLAPVLLALLTAVVPVRAGATHWTPRHFDVSGFILAAEGVAADGTPLMLAVAPSTVDEHLEIRTIYLRGAQVLTIHRRYLGAGELMVEVTAAAERLRARLRPTPHADGWILEYDLPDGRSIRVAAERDGRMLLGDLQTLRESLNAPRGLFALLREYRRDLAVLGPAAIRGADLIVTPEIGGGGDYDRCVTVCSMGCADQCAFECAINPVSCEICQSACGIGCAIGCWPSLRRLEGSPARRG